MSAPWYIEPETCRTKITIESGVLRGERVFCSRKPAKGEDHCGQHLKRSPWKRRLHSSISS